MIEASCHCGAVRLELPRAPRRLLSCNCSICRRNGGLWAYYTAGSLRFRYRKRDVEAYAWGDRMIRPRPLPALRLRAALGTESPDARQPCRREHAQLRSLGHRESTRAPVRRRQDLEIPRLRAQSTRLRRPPERNESNVQRELVEAALPRLARGPGDVRRHDEVRDRRIDQRMTGRRRLALEHVDARRRRACRPSAHRRAPAMSISAPRAVLISTASGFMRARRSRLTRPRVASVSGQCSESTSSSGSRSSRSRRPAAGVAARPVCDLDPHAEGARDRRHRLAERAVADDAECPALQFADRVRETPRTVRPPATARSATSAR